MRGNAPYPTNPRTPPASSPTQKPVVSSFSACTHFIFPLPSSCTRPHTPLPSTTSTTISNMPSAAVPVELGELVIKTLDPLNQNDVTTLTTLATASRQYRQATLPRLFDSAVAYDTRQPVYA